MLTQTLAYTNYLTHFKSKPNRIPFTLCAGPDCVFVDASVHQSVTPDKVCAGQQLSLKLSNLIKAAAGTNTVSLITVSNPNQKIELSLTGKGVLFYNKR